METRKENLVERHLVEMVAGTGGILLALIAGSTVLTPAAAWLAGIISASLAFSVAILKDYIAKKIEVAEINAHHALSVTISRNRKLADIVDTFSVIDGVHLRHANEELEKFANDIQRIETGRLRLTEGQYYQKICQKMRSMGAGSSVYAVNSIDERRWETDPRQLNYKQANNIAINNGATIRRIFVLDRRNLSDTRYHDAFIEVDRQISDEKLQAHVVWRQDLPANQDLAKDWVLFEGDSPEVFQAYADEASGSKHRVWWAEWIIGCDKQGRSNADAFRRDFKELCTFEVPAEMFRDELREATKNTETVVEKSRQLKLPPGNLLEAHSLSMPVVSCEEAASAKGIPLSQELKTIILDTSDGLRAVHVRGNEEVSLRKIKAFLEVEQAQLASREQLDKLGLVPGTVSPIINPVWGLRHLVDVSVLKHEFVSSNNGTLTGYFTFQPKVLLDARDVSVGEFTSTLEAADHSN